MPIDRRKRDANWLLNPNDNGTFSTTDAQLAVLMDIRDELKRLNGLLYCSNFTGIPATLKSINRKFAQKREPK